MITISMPLWLAIVGTIILGAMVMYFLVSGFLVTLIYKYIKEKEKLENEH